MKHSDHMKNPIFDLDDRDQSLVQVVKWGFSYEFHKLQNKPSCFHEWMESVCLDLYSPGLYPVCFLNILEKYVRSE